MNSQRQSEFIRCIHFLRTGGFQTLEANITRQCNLNFTREGMRKGCDTASTVSTGETITDTTCFCDRDRCNGLSSSALTGKQSREIWNDEIQDEIWYEILNEMCYEICNEILHEIWNAIWVEIWNEISKKAKENMSIIPDYPIYYMH